MDASFHSLEGCLREVELTLTADELKPRFEEAYKKFQPTVAIKGFRKGKVPLRMIHSMFGEEIEHDTLQHIAEEEYKKIVEEKKLEPIGQPALSAMDYKRGGDATMKVRYEVKPEIVVADYHGLKIEGEDHVVSDEEITAEIERQRYLESESIPADEILSDDFIANVDVQKLDAETRSAIVGQSQKGMKIYLKRESLQKEIRDGLHNKKVGDTFIVETPADGEEGPTVLQFTVNAIERVELPPLSDEFVKRVSDEKAETVDAYRALVSEEMQRQWAERNVRNRRDQLAEAFVALHEFPIPQVLVEELLRSMLDDYTKQGVPRGFDMAQFDAMMRPSAEWQAKWALVREALIEKEGLNVEDSDLEEIVDKEHARVGIDKERLRGFYKTSEQVRDKILMDKVFALLESGVQK